MKNNTHKLRIDFETQADRPAAIENSKFKIQNPAAFTLIELLVVISIIALLAAFLLTSMGSIKRQRYIKGAQAELAQLETALDNYKAKYGVYPPSNQNNNNLYLLDVPTKDRSQFSQLYYELSGMTNNNGIYYTLDGSSQIKAVDVPTAYGVSGFINCSKGSGEDAAVAKNFLSGLSAKEIFNLVTNATVSTTVLATSAGGPDVNYRPLNASGLNPFRYVYPGVNNPNSYDLWVQLVISGKTNLVCNWNKNVQINNPLP